MRGFRIPAAAVAAALLGGCGDPPTQADRAELIGTWNPDDGSGRTVRFSDKGVFDYLYYTGTVLELDWKLERKGRVALTSANAVTTRCQYKVEGKSLTIDDGAKNSCIGPAVTPPSPMPTAFTRVE